MLQSCTGLLGRREPVRMRLTGMKRVPPSPFADLMRIGSRSRARKSFTLLVRAVKERQNDHHPPPTPTQHALHVGRDGTIILRRCADMHAAASASHRLSRAVLCALDACSPRAHPQERPQTDGPITPTANPNHAQRARCNARLTYGGRGGGAGWFRARATRAAPPRCVIRAASRSSAAYFPFFFFEEPPLPLAAAAPPGATSAAPPGATCAIGMSVSA